MSKLIICRGIPGSGKSYWANEYASTHDNVVVVTRSDIRKEYGLPCEYGGYEKEKLVISEMKRRIIAGLKANKTVISADINIFLEDIFRLEMIVAKYRIPFEIKYFDTPLEICIERDSKRDDYSRVGPEKITKWYHKYQEIMA